MVGKDVAYEPEDTLLDSYADMADGSIVLADLDNKVRDTAAGTILLNAEVVRFVTRIGTQLVYTPQFKLSDVVSMISDGYTAAVQQVTRLGYIGSGTGNIEAIDENEYIVRILLEGTTSTFGNKQMYKFGAFKSSASATSAEVAIGLCDNLYFNFKREAESMIQFDAICNATVTAANGFKNTQDVTVVNGLQYVTCATDVTYEAAGGATLVVGDYLRIGSVGGGTALTDDVYEVITITNTTRVNLDRPVTAASGTYTAVDGTSDIEVIPAATGVAATWGITMTGIARANFSPGVFNYEVVRFRVEPQDCGTTTVTYSTAANPGVGVYGQIAELEWFAQGNLGKKWRVDTPPVTQYTQAASGSTYETITMKYKVRPSGSDSVTGTTPDSYGEIFLAFVVGSDCGDKLHATLKEWADANLATLAAW